MAVRLRRTYAVTDELMRCDDCPPTDAAPLAELIYELLDAHADTATLVREAADETAWDQHLEYLSRLQRVGREFLANGSVGASVAR